MGIVEKNLAIVDFLDYKECLARKTMILGNGVKCVYVCLISDILIIFLFLDVGLLRHISEGQLWFP